MPAGRTSRRNRTGLVAAGFVCLGVLSFAGPAGAQSPAPSSRSDTRAYIALGTGLSLTGLSFVLAEKADRNYARYLAETDPARLEDDYQAARRMDRMSAASLIAGQAGLALGVYWRFLHHAGEAGVRTTPTWGVTPQLGPDGAGLALDVRF